MGLVLRLKQGDRVAVGPHRLLISRVLTADTFYVRADSDPLPFVVGPDQWHEVLPGCKVRSTIPDDPTRKTRTIRIQVDAPGYAVYRVRRLIGEENVNEE